MDVAPNWGIWNGFKDNYCHHNRPHCLPDFFLANKDHRHANVLDVISQWSIYIFVYIFKVCFLRVRTSARLSTIYSPCPLALGFVYFDDFVAITTHFSHFCHSNSFVGTLKTCEHAEIRHGNDFSCNNTQFNILDWMLTQYPKVIAAP